MRTLNWIRQIFVIICICLGLLLSFSWTDNALALSMSPFESAVGNSLSIDNSFKSQSFTEGLHEVPPPGAVQEIRARLDHFHPKLFIESPENDAVLMKGINEQWELILNVKDWPLVESQEFGLGPHLVIQVDDLEPLRISHIEGERVVIPMNSLSPGSHRLVAYLAYPWGEALKIPRASLQYRIHFFNELKGTQPDGDTPWLTVVSPSDFTPSEPLLIDWLIWDAPLQGIKEADDKWRVRVCIDGESFLMDSSESIWLEGLSNDNIEVQFELLNLTGEPINPIFNNQLRVVSNASSVEKPIWISSSWNEIETSRLLAEFLGQDEIDLAEDLLLESSQIMEGVKPQQTDDPSIAKYELIFPRELKE